MGGYLPAIEHGGIVLRGPDSDGTTGQVLSTDGSGSLEWIDPPEGGGSGVPDGGSTGQVLAKASGSDGDVEWATNVSAEAPLILQTSSAGLVPLTVRGAASQTADLQRWTNNTGGAVRALVDASGNIGINLAQFSHQPAARFHAHESGVLDGPVFLASNQNSSANPIFRLWARNNTTSGNQRGTIEFVRSTGALHGFIQYEFTNSGETGLMTFNVNSTDVLQLDRDNTSGNTRFLLYDVDSGSLQRVKVGANGSGPGGVGRALYVAEYSP